MKNFFNTKSIVGRVLIVLLLAGGLVFAGAFAVNIFVPTPTDAASCCGGVEQGTTSDDTSSEASEAKSCCAVKAGTAGTASGCGCGHSNCPTSTCSGCQGSAQECGCHTSLCNCPKICKSASYGCDVGPGKCH